jgi:hypothetical protein
MIIRSRVATGSRRVKRRETARSAEKHLIRLSSSKGKGREGEHTLVREAAQTSERKTSPGSDVWIAPRLCRASSLISSQPQHENRTKERTQETERLDDELRPRPGARRAGDMHRGRRKQLLLVTLVEVHEDGQRVHAPHYHEEEAEDCKATTGYGYRAVDGRE